MLLQVVWLGLLTFGHLGVLPLLPLRIHVIIHVLVGVDFILRHVESAIHEKVLPEAVRSLRILVPQDDAEHGSEGADSIDAVGYLFAASPVEVAVEGRLQRVDVDDRLHNWVVRVTLEDGLVDWLVEVAEVSHLEEYGKCLVEGLVGHLDLNLVLLLVRFLLEKDQVCQDHSILDLIQRGKLSIILLNKPLPVLIPELLPHNIWIGCPIRTRKELLLVPQLEFLDRVFSCQILQCQVLEAIGRLLRLLLLEYLHFLNIFVNTFLPRIVF